MPDASWQEGRYCGLPQYNWHTGSAGLAKCWACQAEAKGTTRSPYHDVERIEWDITCAASHVRRQVLHGRLPAREKRDNRTSLFFPRGVHPRPTTDQSVPASATTACTIAEA